MEKVIRLQQWSLLAPLAINKPKVVQIYYQNSEANLNPKWEETKVWKSVEELPDSLSLRVRVFDSDVKHSS